MIVGASLLQVRERLLAAAARATVPAPAGLAATLRGYQLQGLTWLAELTDLGLGACLADDMGLGKTVTLIALHLHRATRAGSGPTLVVCPASLLGNWEARSRGSPPASPVRRFHGGAPLGGRPGGGGGRPADGRAGRAGGGVRAHDLRHACASTTRPSRRSPGTSSSPTRPSTSRTPARRPPGPCARCPAAPGSRSPAPRSRTTSPSSGRSSTGRSPACSAAGRPSGGSGPRRSSPGWSRPRRGSSPT